MRIEPTAEDLALAMKLHAHGVLEQYQRSDYRDAEVLRLCAEMRTAGLRPGWYTVKPA